MTTTVPAIEGWFTAEPEPALLGTRCTACGTVFFPRAEGWCRNPACLGKELVEHRLSRRGRIWSFTDARYQPPAPFVPTTEPFEPFAIVAVELADEAMIVLGQVPAGLGVDDLAVGMEVELIVDDLFTDDAGTTQTVWKWSPVR